MTKVHCILRNFNILAIYRKCVCEDLLTRRRVLMTHKWEADFTGRCVPFLCVYVEINTILEEAFI